MKKADFDLLATPAPKRARSAQRDGSKGKGEGKGGGKGKNYITNAEGRKIPKHCFSYLKTGTCKFEADNPGKKCINRHMNATELEAETQKLNA